MSTELRCRRCQTPITDDDKQCPFCKTLLKALIHLGDFNGHPIQLYLSYDNDGPQIAALRAILTKFEEQNKILTAIREAADNLRPTNSGHTMVHADTVADNLTAIIDNPAYLP